MPPAPRPLLVAAVAVVLQGVALVGLGLVQAVATVVSDPAEPLGSAVTAALAVVVGLALVALARALRHRRRGARAPLLVAELIGVLVGIQLLSVSVPLGAAVLASAAAAVYGLLHPSTAEVLGSGGGDGQTPGATG